MENSHAQLLGCATITRMATCLTCGAEITARPHKCVDPLDRFDAGRDVFEPVRDEPVEVDDVSRRRWLRAQGSDGPDLTRPRVLD